MQDVSRGEGRTVLFVSHNMASIRALCHNGILLENGSIKYSGDIESVVLEYQRTNQMNISNRLIERLDRKGSGKLKLSNVVFRDINDKVIDRVSMGDAFKISVYVKNCGWTKNDGIAELSVGINDEYGQRNMVMSNQFLGREIEFSENEDEKRIDFIIPRCQLTMGSYTLAFYLSDKFNSIVDWIDNISTLFVEAGDFYGTGKVNRRGLGHFIADYEIQETDSVL